MSTGENIKRIRKFRGMTQKELGIAIGIGEESASPRMAQYETDNRTPRKEMLHKMAVVLDVDPRNISIPTGYREEDMIYRLGGYVFGVGSTLTSFIVLGNYSMGMQVTGKADFIAQYLESGDLYGMIVSIIKTMPGAPVIMVVVLLTMIAFYATSFDSIALTASCYSYHTLEDGEQPNKGIQLMWCILLILLPIALLFAESSMNNLQSVSIVAAFPIGAVIVMIAVSFMKDAKKYMEELGNKK